MPAALRACKTTLVGTSATITSGKRSRRDSRKSRKKVSRRIRPLHLSSAQAIRGRGRVRQRPKADAGVEGDERALNRQRRDLTVLYHDRLALKAPCGRGPPTALESIVIAFQIDDMTCGHCAGTITKAVHDVDASASVEVDLASHRVTVGQTEATSLELASAITGAGFTPMELGVSEADLPGPSTGCCGRCRPG